MTQLGVIRRVVFGVLPVFLFHATTGSFLSKWGPISAMVAAVVSLVLFVFGSLQNVRHRLNRQWLRRYTSIQWEDEQNTMDDRLILSVRDMPHTTKTVYGFAKVKRGIRKTLPDNEYRGVPTDFNLMNGEPQPDFHRKYFRIEIWAETKTGEHWRVRRKWLRNPRRVRRGGS